ncbi:MAG TPA: dual specificity protein phosphatase family protein [Devosiaceae bacterium]|jgi:protein tyrosine phosphatase (PTP) superfamily phosphohydrolase (DUF442 family)
MSAVRATARELRGLFFADSCLLLHAAILITVVAVCVRLLPVPPLAGGIVLLVGCLAFVLQSTNRAFHAYSGAAVSHDSRAGVLFDHATRLATATSIALTIALASLGAFAAYLQFTGNVHAIEPQMAYRSNTLGSAQLQQVIEQNGIRTILNLRGGSMESPWYANEASIAKSHGVALVDVPMSDDRMPEPQTLSALIATLHDAQYPILIHCKAGADRTGLASALFELLVMKKSPQEAAEQLSFNYGHFPWLGSKTGAMDRTFWQVVAETP